MSKAILVLGATGNTGKRVVEQLLEQNQQVRVIVRSKERMLEAVGKHDNLFITESTVLDMSESELSDLVKGCDAVVSCLGHNITMKGMYGKPRKLVTDTAIRIFDTVKKINPIQETKFILMGSNGVANPNGGDDLRPISERVFISIIRALVPPHKDNEKAAEFFCKSVGSKNPCLKWVVVRPDNLLEGEISGYDLFPKPGKGLFSGGEVTRANVAHFMVDLIMNGDTWKKWEFKMPVVMNKPAP